MPEFSGKVVIVTGASGALGEAVTSEFLEAGATVVGAASSWKSDSGLAAFRAVAADLGAAAGARTVVDAALECGGRIDCLVHLVGGFAGGTPVEATPEETWTRMLYLNLFTANNMIREALPHMLAARRGRIVAVGSRAGVEPAAGLGAYSASKAALHALIRCLAEEVKHAGITANAILPSTIDTPANRSAMPSADPSRWVAPRAVAALIRWLASEAAAAVNGALIPIYGRA